MGTAGDWPAKYPWRVLPRGDASVPTGHQERADEESTAALNGMSMPTIMNGCRSLPDWTTEEFHWDVQHPDGSHTNVRADGEVDHGKEISHEDHGMSVILECQPGIRFFVSESSMHAGRRKRFSLAASRTFRIGERLRYVSFRQDPNLKDHPAGWLVVFKTSDGQQYAATQTYFVTTECWHGIKDHLEGAVLRSGLRRRFGLTLQAVEARLGVSEPRRRKAPPPPKGRKKAV